MDPELEAMAKVLEALKPLEPVVRNRVASWAMQKLEIATDVSNAFAEPKREESPPGGALNREGTVSHVARKLEANSCKIYLLAAAAYLTFYKTKAQFAKSELLECAREISGWKLSHNNQVPVNLKRMLDADELIEKANNVFALHPSKTADLESKVA